MKANQLYGLVFSFVAAVSAAGATASAATIDYNISFVGTGSVALGDKTTNFRDVAFSVDVFGDTSSLSDAPNGARLVAFTTANVTADGHTLALGVADDPHFFYTGPGPHPDLGGFCEVVTGVTECDFDFAAPQFAGYDAVSSIAPFPVTVVAFADLYLKDSDADISFTNIEDAVFSASVPEPATWSLLLAGFGGLGAAMRTARSRKGLEGTV